MKIYNQDKTRELSNYEVDLEKGYLVSDKMFVKHHEAVEAKDAVYEDLIEKLSNGSKLIRKKLVSPAVKAKEAEDEYEEIQVFIPYTAEQIKAQKKVQYESRVDELIRSKYTLSQELAILRQQESKSEEYKVYFEYCEECKAKAKAEVYGNEV